MTRFLFTTRTIRYPAVLTLQQIAQQHGCQYVRKSSKTDKVQSWFEGPSLENERESARESIMAASIVCAGIRFIPYFFP